MKTLSRRLQGAFESGPQRCHRQIPEKAGERQLRTLDAIHGIAVEAQRAIKGFRIGPDPAALRKCGEGFCDGDDRSVAATATREGNDMVAMRTADRKGLIVAMSKDAGKFGSQLEEMPG